MFSPARYAKIAALGATRRAPTHDVAFQLYAARVAPAADGHLHERARGWGGDVLRAAHY